MSKETRRGLLVVRPEFDREMKRRGVSVSGWGSGSAESRLASYQGDLIGSPRRFTNVGRKGGSV